MATPAKKAVRRKAPAAKSAPRPRKRTMKKRLEGLVEDMVAKGIRLEEANEQLERQFLVVTMRLHDGNQSRAAAALRLHRNTLRRKLQRHGLL